MATQRFQPPSWAVDPVVGAHITSIKEGEQPSEKIMIDSRKCSTFGRMRDLVDIAFPDQLLSRVHGALFFGPDGVFVIDLGSVHGTFMGAQKLAPNVPTRWVPGVSLRLGGGRTLQLHLPGPSSTFVHAATIGGEPGAPESEKKNGAGQADGAKEAGLQVVLPAKRGASSDEHRNPYLDTEAFGSDEGRKNKFLSLLGAFKGKPKVPAGQPPPPPPGSPPPASSLPAPSSASAPAAAQPPPQAGDVDEGRTKRARADPVGDDAEPAAQPAQSAGAAGGATGEAGAPRPNVLTAEGQERFFDDLQRQYEASWARRRGGSVGLGFGS